MTTLQEIEATRQRLEALVEKEPTTPAEGVNHVAVISADLERAVRFYRDVLGMALTSVTANRDEPRSTHINIALGRGTMLSLFDFPNVKGQAVQGTGGLMHLALWLPRERLARIEAALNEHQVPHQRIHDSIYFKDPDGMTLELTLVS